jgi:ATP-dependent DNA helicase RecQ
VRTLFHRKNLHLDAIVVKDDDDRLKQIVASLKTDLAPKSPYRGAGIIYVTVQKTTKQIQEYLKGSGFVCRPYHAGMSVKERNETQEWFMEPSKGSCKIICATIAFGMGIDKSDIRFVVSTRTLLILF